MTRKFTKLMAALALLALLIPLTGWGQTTVTYTQISKTEISVSDGTAPTNSSATFSTTYSNMNQLTSGNSMTLTLYGYEGYRITAITLSMKSNASKGAGTLSVTAGSETLASISPAANFNTSSWYGAWSTDYVDVNIAMSNASYDIQSGEDVTIVIAATVNSLYCQSFTLTYEETGGGSDPSITISGEEISNNAVSFDWNNTADHTASVVYQNLDEREAELCLYETYENGVCSNKVTNMSNYWLLAMFGDNDEVITYAATNANGSANDRTVYMRVEAYDGTEIYSSNVIAITQTARPTYTVTYDCNGGTSGCPENVSGVLHGASITLAAAPTKTDYIFNGWSDGTTTYQAGATYTVTGDITFTAQWSVDPNAPQYEWVETALADLATTDVFVIVGTREGTYAMTNDNGTSYQPTAASVTITDGKLSAAPADNLKWNINGNATSGYTFYPNGITSTWLYCNTTNDSGSNTNMRVGTGARKLFVLDDDNYLLTKDNYVDRYVSVYHGNNGSDWRGYVSTTTAPTTVTFYKRQQVSTDPFITLDEEGIEAPGTGKEGYIGITYGNFPDPELISLDYYFCDAEGNDLEEGEDPDWIDAELVTENGSGEQGDFLHYTISANDGAARTAYAKVYIDEDDYYSIVTFSQAAAPQQYTLTVEPFENLELITFVNNEMVMEGDGEIQVNEGDHIMLSIVADDGYVMETLMVNSVDHVNDIDEDFTYEFDMPAEAVTISATAVEYVAPIGGNYVRITSLEQLTDGSKVIIAARYNENVTEYRAMKNILVSGKATSVQFTSTTSGDDEILPAAIVDAMDDYYWVVNSNADGYTFTNANDNMIGYGTSGTNFVMGGTKTRWTIEYDNSDEAALVGEYNGFVIKNKTTTTRAFAYSSTEVFGAYSTDNMTGNNASTYNFFLDFFVQSEAPAPETYELTITGNTWYFIASPVGTAPTNMDALSDLYFYDEQDHHWRNKKINANEAGFDFAIGKGYLAANADLETTPDPITLTFTGVAITDDSYPVDLEYHANTSEGVENTLAGWNLVGNPFKSNAYIERNYYVIGIDDETGKSIIVASEGGAIAPYTGVMVQAEGEGESVTFTTNAPENPSNGNLQMTVAQQVVTRDGVSTGSTTIDNAIVSFNEGSRLGKFYFGENDANIYIPQNGKEYAIVSAEAQGEMPVNFRATKNGTYTLTINPEGVEMNYLHLIDNMTGANIDLLQTPSYTFNASMNDYESRFKLVFAAGSSTGSEASETFAFFANGELIVSNEGEATLQVVDMTGRILSSQSLNGNGSVKVNAPVGVYVLRLINGNEVKTQKIVVR